MKQTYIKALLAIVYCCTAWLSHAEDVVYLPTIHRAANHHVYAQELLVLALDNSVDKYGAYKLQRKDVAATIKRQLRELEKGTQSVAISMPTPDWRAKALMVPFPLLKGLASYRLFITTKSNQQRLADIDTAADLKQVPIGQGEGWSTANILQAHGYKVVYGSDYAGLFKMLEAQRFQLLMRGVYEAEREIAVYRSQIPDLEIYDRFAVYTYLPMYFWVSKQQPELAERLHYGLMKAHDNGELDLLFQRYFSGTIALLGIADLNIIELENTNIDPSFYLRDRPFLLSDIH